MISLAIFGVLLAASQKPLGSFDDSAPKQFKSVGVRGAIDGGGYAASANAKTQSEFFELLVDLQVASLPVPCDELLARGATAAAIGKLEALVRIGKDSSAQRLLGLAYESAGQFEAAAEQFHATGDSFAQSVALLLAGDSDQAQDVSRLDSSTKALLSLGAALFQQGGVSQAIDTFFKAVHAQDSGEAPYKFLAIAIRTADSATVLRTIDRLSHAAQQTPSNAGAHYALACALLVSDQPTRVESELKQAIALDPHFAEAHFQLAALYAGRQDLPAGIAEYSAALDCNPHLIEARYRLSQLYARSGQAEQAKEQLDIHQKLRAQQKKEIESGQVPIKFCP